MMRWDCKDIDRDAIIHELILEAGLTDAPGLTDSLKALESFASMPAPVPGPALAAMLAGSAVGASAGAGTATGAGDPADNLPVDELGTRRQSRKHRPVVIGAAVLTAMGLGVGGVAASSAGFSRGTPDFMQALISGWAPGWTTAPPSLVPPAPTRDSPKVTTHPAPVGPPAAMPAAPPVAGLTDPVAPAPVSPAEVAPAAVPAPASGSTEGQFEPPKAAQTEAQTDSRDILQRPTTDIPPHWIAGDPLNRVQQAVQSGQDDVTLKSAGASLRWLLGLLSR